MITKNKNWSEILIQQQQSGLTIAEFCKKFNISTSSFYKHRSTRSNSQSAEKPLENSPSINFVELDAGQSYEMPISNPTLRLSNQQGVVLEVYL